MLISDYAWEVVQLHLVDELAMLFHRKKLCGQTE